MLSISHLSAVSLSPVNSAAIAKLPAPMQEIIIAGLAPKVNEQTALEAVTILTGILATTFTIAGQQPDAKTLALYADELYNKLAETYPAIAMQEVRTALRKGVYGEYGEFYGLNPRTFMQFIRAYLHAETRIEARKEFEYHRLALTHYREFSHEEKEENNKDFVNLLYADFLKGILLADYIPEYLYDFLNQQQGITLFPDKKTAIFNYFERCKAEAKETIFETTKLLKQ